MKSKGFSKLLIIGAILLAVVFGLFFFANKGYKFPEEINSKDVDLIQLNAPEKGQKIATVDTTEGTFKIVLYEKEAPATVAHFIKLVNDGYYDGTYVYKIAKDNDGKGQYFQGGTKKQDGFVLDTKNKKKDGFDQNLYDIEHTSIDVERSKNLWPIKGAIVSTGIDSKGSGTFILGINSLNFDDKLKSQLNEMVEKKKANKDIVDAFLDKGGVPNIPYNITIFAQVYEGMDSYEKIFDVDTDKKSGAPKEAVKINKITLSTYGE